MFNAPAHAFTLHSTEAPLLVALPGSGCSPSIYDEVHIDGWTVHALDWSNSGGSVKPADVAHRIVDALANREAPTALAGHSTGGAIAILATALAPGKISRLIVSNTGVHSRHHGDPTLPERIRTGWSSEAQQAFLRACFDREPPPALWCELCAYLAHLPADVVLQSVMGLRALDLTDALARIACPTLIAHGRLDRRRAIGDAQALAAGIADATLALLPGGHTPMVDCTADYNAALSAFLTSRPVAGTSLNLPKPAQETS